MAIIGCINCYNDMPLIEDCIESIYDKVDKIICVDGSYDDYPNGSGLSIDGTIGYLESLDKIDLITVKGATEVEKRNLYLTKCNEGDVIINLDSDEVLIGNIPSLNSDFGIIDLYDGHSKHIQKRATRFFKFKTGLHYENVHYTFYYNGQIVNKLHEIINKDFTFEFIKDFYLLHNWHLRTDKRKYDKQIYYKQLVRKEAGFIK